MKKITTELIDNVDLKEIEKNIGYISDKIIGYLIRDGKIELSVDDETNEEELLTRYKEFFSEKTKVDKTQHSVFENKRDREYYTEHQVLSPEIIMYMGEGIIGFKGIAKRLFEIVDSLLVGMLDGMEYEERIYPVLLPLDKYEKTGYLDRSPQYSIFCNELKEDMKTILEIPKCDGSRIKEYYSDVPRFVLSPSACFHVYQEFENTTLFHPLIITFRQSVFRNEGRFNWNEFGRLRGYNIREIVFIGSKQFVEESLKKTMAATELIMKTLDINCEIITSCDFFVRPELSVLQSIQLVQKSKYELRINYCINNTMACGSFNFHGTAFSRPFNIKIEKEAQTVTGCIGFGIERIVLCFLAQYGTDKEKWPQRIKELL